VLEAELFTPTKYGSDIVATNIRQDIPVGPVDAKRLNRLDVSFGKVADGTDQFVELDGLRHEHIKTRRQRYALDLLYERMKSRQ
jgi:hypothetical protein